MPTRIFWPVDGLQRYGPEEKSIVVGWVNSSKDYVVMAILPYFPVQHVQRLLEQDMLVKGLGEKSPQELYKEFGGDRLQVLGTCNHSQDCLFVVNTLSGQPVIDSGSDSVQLIYYSQPNAKWLHYLSLYPIQLDMPDESVSQIIDADYNHDSQQASEDRSLLLTNLSLHCGGQIQSNASERMSVLAKCISQINCSLELSRILTVNALKMFPELQSRELQQSRRLSISSKIGIEAKHQASIQAEKLGIFAIAKWVVLFTIVSFNVLAEALLQITAFPVGNSHLTDISATALQVDLRLKLLCNLPVQYMRIRKRSKSWATTALNVEYTRFYNSLWLFANDIILGVTLGGFLRDNHWRVCSFITTVTQNLFGDQFQEFMNWLMSWPAGLKLNTELAKFFGEVFVWVLVSWQHLLLYCTPLLQGFIVFLSHAGWFGITFQISLVCDLISLITFDIYCLYLGSAKIYRKQLTTLVSLFRLFRGKKLNVLRSRVDSGNYNIDQLLLGTIMFTVLLLLLPTVLVFYLAFAFTRALLVLLSTLLEMTLAFFNHFPLFTLLLRFKSPARVPGGIRFEYIKNDSTQTFLKLESQPIGIGHIFHQYNVVAKRFAEHYYSTRVLSGLLVGKMVTVQRSRLYSLLYSSLPAHRPAPKHLYNQLQSHLFDKKEHMY